MKVYEISYSNTNTYLIEGTKGKLLFDTGWAGTFPAFCRFMGNLEISVQSINYIMISHFHPDHMGIVQEIAELGPKIIVMETQKEFMHSADAIFVKEAKYNYKPIDNNKVKIIKHSDSRQFLKEIGIDGEIIHTPGHSEDSISLYLDDGTIFVGDLNPLYELELHKGTQIAESWEKLLTRKPQIVYYGHARKAELIRNEAEAEIHVNSNKKGSHEFESKIDYLETKSYYKTNQSDKYSLVMKIMRYIDKGVSLERIQKKTGADSTFIEDVARMYLTHKDVGVQGILDRIEIKGR
ncbi:MAG: MBL fold metallo-hydrolase [Lachnospiraceae bacterium]|nr:MBL fold metallo-hydrolase [Lachnospiraceae bacterium]